LGEKTVRSGAGKKIIKIGCLCHLFSPGPETGRVKIAAQWNFLQ
jgi:hypothetical protein